MRFLLLPNQESLPITGVYQSLNTSNGRFYFGSTCNIRQRYSQYLTRLKGSNRPHTEETGRKISETKQRKIREARSEI